MYDLSFFTADFILAKGEPYKCETGYVKNAQGLPVSLYGAICASLSVTDFRNTATYILKCEPAHVTAEALLDLARETNMCDNLTVPVEVHIDPEGALSVFVYDNRT